MSKLRTWLYAEENATQSLHIAATAMQCDRDPVVNRSRIEATVEAILREHPETELIMFGEMLMSWYDPAANTNRQHPLSEPIPGQSSDLLGRLAKKFGIYICCGLSETAEDKFYNAQVLLNPQGELQAVHRKKNLKRAEREAGYVAGTKDVTITEIKGFRSGMIICADAADPRTMRAMMRSSLDLVLYSLADDRDENWFMAQANARLYDAWIVSANRFGQEKRYWNGHTIISDPVGKLRAVLIDQEGYLFHTLRFAQDRSGLQRMIRKAYARAPLPIHILKNWQILRSYYG
jgi:predicted amidohydrolase